MAASQTAAQRAGEYLYEHVTPSVFMEDMAFRDGTPGPGGRLPEIDLPTAEGGRFRSRELVERGRPMLLVTGSYTCPMTASSNPMLKRLHARFGDHVEFVLLHAREAHPGERFDQVDEAEQKRQHARALKERDGLPWSVAVDDPSGTVHRVLDGKPNAAWLTDGSGGIVFRSLWAGDERGMTQALEAVANGERPLEAVSNRRMVPMAKGVGMMRESARRAGPRAGADLWRAAPPMALLAWVADLYRPLPPQWRTAAAVATLGVGVAIAAALISRATSDRR
ncbi:MAG TPA: hypothetical protein VGN83_24335 [Falsiroseomonas sp.]|jgi:hypothetical protein|nr:hypothetical protein [Falsiroseomonas sp.]